MRAFDAIRTVQPVKLGDNTESFFSSGGARGVTITSDGGPFVSVKRGDHEVLVPLPNVVFLVPAKAEKPAPVKK